MYFDNCTKQRVLTVVELYKTENINMFIKKDVCFKI